jgi:transcriptional regulator with XRE-family HTH domain
LHEILIIWTMPTDINRLKAVLAEQKRTGKWLAEQLDKDPTTVSKWCSNTIQPSLDTLKKISDLLQVNIQTLINPTNTNTIK